jgi:hypothetical protein
MQQKVVSLHLQHICVIDTCNLRLLGHSKCMCAVGMNGVDEMCSTPSLDQRPSPN